MYKIHSVVWKNAKFTPTKIFLRQINSLLIYLVNTLVSRNFCHDRVRVNFRNFYIALWRFPTQQEFRETNFSPLYWFHQTKNVSKNSFLTTFLLIGISYFELILRISTYFTQQSKPNLSFSHYIRCIFWILEWETIFLEVIAKW